MHPLLFHNKRLHNVNVYSSSTSFFLGNRSHHVSNLDHRGCQQSKKKNWIESIQFCCRSGRFEDLNIWLEKHRNPKWFDFHIDSTLFTAFDKNKIDRIMWLYIHIFSQSLFNSLSLIMIKKCFNSLKNWNESNCMRRISACSNTTMVRIS